MVSDLKARQPSIDETLQMRQQAKVLLDRLVADRAAAEQRLAESGKRDPIRTVTGRTALDSAIASARQMIDHIEDLLAQMGYGDSAPVPAVVQFPSRRVFKPQVRLNGKHGGPTMPTPVSVPVSAVAS